MKTTKVEVSLVLGQKEWDPDLADPESEKYKAFMAEFEAMVSFYVTFLSTNKPIITGKAVVVKMEFIAYWINCYFRRLRSNTNNLTY